jgi:subtilisin-like proprotein convertase family protein
MNAFLCWTFFRTPATTAAVAVLLSACGGGGGGGASPAATSGSSFRPVESSVAPAGLSAGANCDIRYSITQHHALSGADPLFPQQWHLRNVGQTGGLPGEDLRIAGAWALGRGEGVTVAVVDDAIELVHPDLAPNVVPGSVSFRPGNAGGWPVPCLARDDDHGTAVAGILLARDDNAIGGSGVAPRASLIGYDALSTSIDLHLYEALTRDNQKVAIYQNSWGSPDTGAVSDAGSLFSQAIARGIDQGRGGLGSIFVFSSGNGGPADNANLDGFINQRGVIAVCGVDDHGKRTPNSEPGANLLVCAPSAARLHPTRKITTTALRGEYRDDFSGASAATPMVSGVVALMLSARPSNLPALTWRDIPLILARTARRNDTSDPDWAQAAGGSGWVHPFYGYGVVDAEAATRLATTWTSVGGSGEQKRCDSTLQTPARAIPDQGAGAPLTVSLSLDCPQITRIEFVEIEVTTSHGNHGDLKLDLRSPAGQTSPLTNARICHLPGVDPCGAYSGWRFGSIRHLDEAASGSWRLTVADLKAGHTGTLQSWRIIVHGR